MNHIKIAKTDHPVHELIAVRWSPYAFSTKAVSKADLVSIFEAARWAASSYNEQPWTYILATREEEQEFDKLLSCLVEGNQAWAKNVSALAIGCFSTNFTKNGKPNAAAQHDLGLAAGNICMEATARGIAVHQMIGIVADKVRQTYSVPEGVQPHTALAFGYEAEMDKIPEALRERDMNPRTRKPLRDFVFGGKWGSASKILG